MFLRSILNLFLVSGVSGSSTVLVTGATGRTGMLVYRLLKDKGVNVRALVRNTTKARAVLNCSNCDASEGIFVGDVTQKETLAAAMKGTTALAIASSASPHCTNFKDPTTCEYPKGAYPVDVDFNGVKKQVETFALASAGSPGLVVVCSTMGTTTPDSFLDKIGHGYIGFYKLNAEAFLMSSGIPYSIIKPCGLTDDEAGKLELRVGHDDQLHEKPQIIPRGNVARVMVEALIESNKVAGVRFDLCSCVGTPTTDSSKVFEAAR